MCIYIYIYNNEILYTSISHWCILDMCIGIHFAQGDPPPMIILKYCLFCWVYCTTGKGLKGSTFGVLVESEWKPDFKENSCCNIVYDSMESPNIFLYGRKHDNFVITSWDRQWKMNLIYGCVNRLFSQLQLLLYEYVSSYIIIYLSIILPTCVNCLKHVSWTPCYQHDRVYI